MLDFFGVPKMFQREIVEPTAKLSQKIFTIIHGLPHTGKTHAACNMVYERLFARKIKNAFYTTVEGFMDAVHQDFSEKRGPKTLQAAKKCGVLVLDDYLVTNRQRQENWDARINEMLRDRFHNERQTLICMEMTPNEASQSMASRLRTRLFKPENLETLHFRPRILDPKNLGSIWHDKIKPQPVPDFLQWLDVYRSKVREEKENFLIRSFLEREDFPFLRQDGWWPYLQNLTKDEAADFNNIEEIIFWRRKGYVTTKEEEEAWKDKSPGRPKVVAWVKKRIVEINQKGVANE